MTIQHQPAGLDVPSPNLMDVAELMQASGQGALTERTGALLWGVAEMHRSRGRATTCSECNNAGDKPVCPLIETATEVAFAWLIQQARP